MGLTLNRNRLGFQEGIYHCNICPPIGLRKGQGDPQDKTNRSVNIFLSVVIYIIDDAVWNLSNDFRSIHIHIHIHIHIRKEIEQPALLVKPATLSMYVFVFILFSIFDWEISYLPQYRGGTHTKCA